MQNGSDEFRQLIETEVLNIIEALAQKKEVPDDKIRRLALITLNLIRPEMSLEELYLNAVKLDDQNPELSPVVFNIMKAYEEKYEKRALDQVSSLIKEKKFDEAQDVVKKVLKFKISA